MRARLLERLAKRPSERVIPASIAAEGASGDDPDGGPAPLPAAVLVPIVARADGLTVLLTRRTEHLNDHPGQISFPGGRIEAEDADPAAAALRETEEEIGLGRSRVQIIGYLDCCLTGTGFRVVPVVGLVAPPLHLKLGGFEVAEVFEVPLDFILDPANHRRRTAARADGRRREFYALDYRTRCIWGATARILVNLCETVAER